MRIGSTILGLGLVLGAAAPGAAFGGEWAASGTAWVTARGGNEEGFQANRMNRGDNPFGSVRALLFTRGTIDDGVSFFLEVPLELGAVSSTFLTYMRPFVRVESVGGLPWLNAQAGKLPTLFGAYGERTNGAGNGLSSTPLLFFHHSAVRRDLIPADADELVASWRGRGGKFLSRNGRSSFVGLPAVYDPCWDIGAELYGAASGIEFSGAITLGTVSAPASSENMNDGYGFAGRVGYAVTRGGLRGLRAGISAAGGPYLNADVAGQPEFPAGTSVEDFWNTAIGADLAFARGAWRFFAEAGRVGYEVPTIESTLHATGYYLEVERKLGPRWVVAFRQDGIDYGDVATSRGKTDWDFDANRAEVGVTYRYRPNTRIKLNYQATRFPDAPQLDGDLVGLQLVVTTR